MQNRKSTPIILIGIAVFVIGGAALFLLLRNDHKTKKPTASRPTITASAPATASSASSSAASQVKVPTGDDAVSVQMDYFPGAGGFARAGDVVNVYAVINKDCHDPKTSPLGVKLAVANAKVLQVAESAAGQAGQPANFLLGVTPQEAEKLIFLKTAYSLYFAITSPNQPPPSTTGISCTNAL